MAQKVCCNYNATRKLSVSLGGGWISRRNYGSNWVNFVKALISRRTRKKYPIELDHTLSKSSPNGVGS